ncbi:hypothetical protein CPC16_010479 [Podila verticillata]|nr:hypothetical protein BGZ52_004657 [Haplosporangium bisporale]KAF9207046.1 hypothetical protein BGZ59_011372 [Podila verticillata]KAF9380081.1 hypothetical protein CPC16_010479 [Podila verticillata]
MEYFYKFHSQPRTEKEREVLYGRIRKIAYWLDSYFNIGGVKVGFEAIVGFIPVIGDFLGLIAALYQVYLSHLFGIPFYLLLRMLANVLIDFVVGLVPTVGDFLDAFYKSNSYNLNILSSWLIENRLVDVERFNREHPLGNGDEPGPRTRSRTRAAGVGTGSSYR